MPLKPRFARPNKGGLGTLASAIYTPIDADLQAQPKLEKRLVAEISLNR